MKFYEIKTARLVLTRIDPESYNFIFTTYDDAELAQFFGFETAEQLAVEKDRFAKGTVTFNRTFCYFRLAEKQSGRVLGICGFHTVYLYHDRAELFYYLNHEEDKRLGYVSEALEQVLAYGFGQMKLHRVEAGVGENNAASLATLKKFAFTQEARLREHYLVNGVHEDSLFFSLLKSEYETR